jgi:hypothetical protein
MNPRAPGRVDWLAQARAFVTIVAACVAGIAFATGSVVVGVVGLAIANLAVCRGGRDTVARP